MLYGKKRIGASANTKQVSPCKPIWPNKEPSTHENMDFNTIATLSRYSDATMSDSITRLFQAVQACRHDDPSTSRTARLLRSGRSKMAKKLAEEAVEVVIDAMHGDRDAVVKESADLLYNLVVLWVSSGIRPEDVWREMDRRERLLGIAEKVPKKVLDDSARRQIIALESRRVRKRR
jgi:phosphoribosyl-ATP pyrophosphohydrolase